MRKLTLIKPAEPGKSVAKVIDKNGVKIKDYDLGQYVQFEILQYENFHLAVAGVLSKSERLLILGELTPHGLKEHKEGIVSRRLKKPKGEEQPTICDRFGCELILDIDSHTIPGYNPLSPESGIKIWLNSNGIDDVHVTWQITASQKLDTEVARLRLYIELDKEYSLDVRKKYARSMSCDGSVFTCSQPIYTSKPVIHDGDDFIKTRSGFIPGKQSTLKFPDINKIVDKKGAPIPHGFDINTAFASIKTSEDYHNALRGLALSQANRQLTAKEIFASLKGTMLLVDEKHRDKRWSERFGDTHLSDLANSAVRVVEEEKDVKELPDIEVDAFKTIEMDYPPGLMGELCREAYEMQHHPNKTLAIMASFALIAGICGRKYNVNGTGVNLYISLLMDTGQGKKSITDIIDRALMLSENSMFAPSFKGKQSFTGAKPLFDMLSKGGMSKVSILTEAGLLNQKQSGDQAGLTRAILDLYTKSGADDFAGDEGYSSSENNIPLLRAPALTLIMESTPDSFIESLAARNSERSGELARMWIARFTGDKKYLNRNKRRVFSDDVQKKINHLIKICAPEQGLSSESKTERPKVIDIGIPDRAWEYSNYWVDRENGYRKEGRQLQQVMCTRAFLKSMKIMSILSIFNSDDPLIVNINDSVHDWVDSNPIRLEMDGIIDLFTRESTSDTMSIVKQVMIPNIIKILKNKFNSISKVPSKELRDRGIFTHSNATQVLSGNSVIKKMSTNTYNIKDGITKMLDYMVDTGLLHKVPSDELPNRVAKAYQITKDFEVLADGYYNG